MNTQKPVSSRKRQVNRALRPSTANIHRDLSHRHISYEQRDGRPRYLIDLGGHLVGVSAAVASLALALLEGEADLGARWGTHLGVGVVAVSAAVASLALTLLELVADASRAALSVATVAETAAVSAVALASLERVARASSAVGGEVGESTG